MITLGSFGRFGYAAEFGLLTLPLFLLWWRSRGLPSRAISPYVGPLALLLGINMVDLLPNATITPITWMLAGSLLGHAERLRVARRRLVPIAGQA